MEILQLARENPQRWGELREHLGVAEATLGRYLNELTTEGVLKKQLDDNGKKVYVVNEDELEESEWYEMLENREANKEIITDHLEEKGAFNDAMTLKEVREFTKLYSEELNQLPLNYDWEELSDIELAEGFLDIIRIICGEDTELELDFRIK